MTTVTRAEFARRKNVYRSTVTRWIESGRIKLNAEGNIDLESAEALLPKTASPMPHHMARSEQIAEQKALALSEPDQGTATGATGRNSDGNDDATIDQDERASLRLKLARVRREEADADTAAMRRDEQARLLVKRADADFVMADFGRTVGALLDRLPDQYTPEVLACRGDQHLIHTALTSAARDLRTEIAHHMRRRAEEILGPGPTT